MLLHWAVSLELTWVVTKYMNHCQGGHFCPTSPLPPLPFPAVFTLNCFNRRRLSFIHLLWPYIRQGNRPKHPRYAHLIRCKPLQSGRFTWLCNEKPIFFPCNHCLYRNLSFLRALPSCTMLSNKALEHPSQDTFDFTLKRQISSLAKV